jgi:hypothetical protein
LHDCQRARDRKGYPLVVPIQDAARPSPRRRRGATRDRRQGALPLLAGFDLAGYEVQYDVDRLHEVVFEADRQRMLHPLRAAVPDDEAGIVVRFKGMGFTRSP